MQPSWLVALLGVIHTATMTLHSMAAILQLIGWLRHAGLVYSQLTSVKSRYLLTSITWPYCMPRLKAHWGHVSFEVDHCPSTGFWLDDRFKSSLLMAYYAAMLCHAMVCYATLCYAAMLCYATVCYAMLCYAMLCYAMLCYAMLCYAMLCYAMLCYSMLCGYAVLHICYAMPCSLLCKCQSVSLLSHSVLKTVLWADSYAL